VNRTQEVIETNLQENQNATPDDPTDTPSAEMIEAEYSALMESGKAKRIQKNYADARIDLEKALALRMTTDVVLLLEEVKIEEQKALFKEIAPWGEFFIVQKKANNLIGVYNNKGIEVIDCIYLSLGRPSDNSRRAFLREDGLWDIYNAPDDPHLKGQVSY
jgi:hypothetical protein